MSAPAFTGHADDVIDALLTRTGGLVLGCPNGSTGGEYDYWRELVSRRDVRRLIGAGLVRADGERADVLAEVLGVDTGDEAVRYWFAECLAGLDIRAARRAGHAEHERERDDVDDAEVPADGVDDVTDRVSALQMSDAPEWFHAWCARTVHAPKLAELVALGHARWCGGAEPAPSDAAWSGKLRAKFAKRCER